MSPELACPICTLTDLLTTDEQHECVTCGHEWARELEPDTEAAAVAEVKDANGNPLATGDTVTLIKDLKMKGSSAPLKAGTRIKSIRIVDAVDGHDIDCKVDGMGVMLKSSFVKKA